LLDRRKFLICSGVPHKWITLRSSVRRDVHQGSVFELDYGMSLYAPKAKKRKIEDMKTLNGLMLGGSVNPSGDVIVTIVLPRKPIANADTSKWNNHAFRSTSQNAVCDN